MGFAQANNLSNRQRDLDIAATGIAFTLAARGWTMNDFGTIWNKLPKQSKAAWVAIVRQNQKSVKIYKKIERAAATYFFMIRRLKGEAEAWWPITKEERREAAAVSAFTTQVPLPGASQWPNLRDQIRAMQAKGN